MSQELKWIVRTEEDRDAIASDLVAILMADQSRSSARELLRQAFVREWYAPFIVGFAVAGVLAILGMLGDLWNGKAWPPVLVGMMLFGSFTAFLAAFVRFWPSRFHSERWLRIHNLASEWTSKIDVGTTVEIGERGIVICERHSQVTLKWSWLQRVIAHERGVLLHGDATITIVFLPTRHLGDATNHSRAIDEINRLCSLYGKSDIARLSEILSDRDFKCENCGYNLRGATKPFCPECGFRIDVLEVENATRR